MTALTISVDPSSPTPPYEQLRQQLAQLIELGTLTDGTRLPPVRQLAADLGLAAGTVARTYRELEAAGHRRDEAWRGHPSAYAANPKPGRPRGSARPGRRGLRSSGEGPWRKPEEASALVTQHWPT